MSIFVYLILYPLMVPLPVQLVRPIFLDKIITKNNCSRVRTGEIPLLKPMTNTSLLVPGEIYRFRVTIHLPETSQNMNQMFMIRLKLIDSQSEVRNSYSRPSVMLYKTELLRNLQTLAFLPLYVVGHYDESQVLSVALQESFEFLEVSENDSLVLAKVELTDNPGIRIYSAFLSIDVHLSGLRYFVVKWPFLSFAIGVTLIFLLFACFLIHCSWNALFNDSHSGGPSNQVPREGGG
jgi:hypothetical protein